MCWRGLPCVHVCLSGGTTPYVSVCLSVCVCVLSHLFVVVVPLLLKLLLAPTERISTAVELLVSCLRVAQKP